jgi:glycosyltransferase involved in cell wall biosynthesis
MNSTRPVRVLYVSDIPVELSYAGPTLIYRLLEDYPAHSLLIVQGMEINPSGRLTGVRYQLQKSAWLERLKVSRLREWISGLLVLQEWLYFRRLIRLADQFKPDVIVTVSFRLKWLQALWLAQRNHIPLHVILHDDWLLTEKYGVWQPFLSRQFKRLYGLAAGKYCISRTMEAYYKQMFGVSGQVLYPSRGKSDVQMSSRIRNWGSEPVRYCYAGTLFTSDFAPLLDRLARVIGEAGGELHMFTNEKREHLSGYNYLTRPHVTYHGMVAPEYLRKAMYNDMDVAILINSFEVEVAFRYNFSSKLVEYTTAGLPVLIWGPSTSGAVSWAIESGYEGVILENSDGPMEKMVRRFANPEIRLSLAKHIQASGQKQFDYEQNRAIFHKGITGGYDQ